MPLSRFQNKHYKKGIFIVGNGDTVSKQDLSPLKDRLTIAVNVNPLPFDPTFLVFMDPVAKIVDKIGDSKSVKITRNVKWKSNVPVPEGTIVINGETSSITKASGSWKGKLYMGNSSLVAGMHLAWIMGCNPVVLIGAPLCIVNDKKRFHEKKLDLIVERSRRDRERLIRQDGYWTTRYYLSQRRFITAMSRNMAKVGIRVYNATEGGILNTIPAIRLANAIEVTAPFPQKKARPKVVIPKKKQHHPTRTRKIPKPVQKPLRRRVPNPKPAKSMKRNLPPLDLANVAMVTLVNDGFMPGYVGLVKSLLKYNPGLNVPLFVMHSAGMCKLSEKNRKRCKELYPNAELYKVNESRYAGINFNRSVSQRFNVSYLTLEAFTMKDFKKVLFIDSDILCLGDISHVLTKNVDFGAVPDTNRYSLKEAWKDSNNTHTRFNGGLLSIGKKYLANKTFSRLIKLAKTGHTMADQHTMNMLFKNEPIFYFDSRYNALKRGFQDNKNKDFLKNVRLLHFIGRKPWISLKDWKAKEPRMRMRETGYDHIDKLWKDHYKG